ncbi:MAG TPA: type II toxin-antitoxin system VapC family toxin [Ktedonobacteraceae bacterium]|jgi:tRNA(fMet)-specific endonuclease VapC|nr:type II toxin-antitoxin system VapC family toxin [Ktedonobacteraceae bacterium]
MKYLVDTDWVIDYPAGRQPAIALLIPLTQEGLAGSLITLGEIYEGIYYGRDPQKSEAGFRHFLRGISVLSLNRSIMQRFGYIRGDLRRKGLLIGDPDILIAATAMYYDLTLLSRNRKDYERIQGLKANFPP